MCNETFFLFLVLESSIVKPGPQDSTKTCTEPETVLSARPQRHRPRPRGGTAAALSAFSGRPSGAMWTALWSPFRLVSTATVAQTEPGPAWKPFWAYRKNRCLHDAMGRPCVFFRVWRGPMRLNGPSSALHSRREGTAAYGAGGGGAPANRLREQGLCA